MPTKCAEGHEFCIGYNKCELYLKCPTPSLKRQIDKGLKEVVIDGKLITLEEDMDTSLLSETLPKIKELTNAFAYSTAMVKKAEEEKKNIRDELLVIIKETGIRKISENDLTFSATPRQRFKEWSDETAVLEMIPDIYKNAVRTVNYKIVKDLIKKGKIPESILDLAIKSDPNYFLTFTEGAKK